MEQGTIIQWEKGEGDRLEEGDIIAQVETDKATMDMETPSEGYLAKIIIPAGSKDLPLGKVRRERERREERGEGELEDTCKFTVLYLIVISYYC